MRCLVPILSLVVFAAQAGPFRNLGFEEANTNNVTAVPGDSKRGYGMATDLLPGWQLYAGAQPVTRVGFNSGGDIVGESSTLYTRGGLPSFAMPPDGQLAFAFGPNRGGPDYALVQNGDIPSDARYLTFTTTLWGVPTVFINGIQPAPAKTFESTLAPQTLYYDVSGYAGKFVELSFVVRSNTRDPSAGFLDSIAFTNVVPEPGTVTLLALGGALLAFRQYRRCG